MLVLFNHSTMLMVVQVGGVDNFLQEILYTMYMESIADIQFVFPAETARSNRNALLKQLYELYVSQPEINRKENRKRYHAFVRLHCPAVCKKAGFDKEKYFAFKDEFRKAKLPKDQQFVKYIPENRFWFKFTHIPTEDLNYVISVARDKYNRGSCVAQYIMGSVKVVDKPLA